MVYFYDANRCSEDDTGAGRCHALGRGLKKKQIIGEGYYIGMVTEQESKLPYAFIFVFGFNKFP